MKNEIKILQFLSERNGRCTHDEFNKECDTDTTYHLAAEALIDLIHTGKVLDDEVNEQ